MAVKKKSAKKQVMEFQDIKDKVKSLVRDIDSNWYDLSIELNNIYENGAYTYWNYDSFREYVEQDLQLEYRVAMYRVKIAKAIEEYGIFKDDVLEIGWTKFKEIIPFLSEDQSKNMQLFDMAKEMTVKELQVALKEDDKEAKESKAVLSITFKFNKEQAEVLEEAFKTAESILGTSDKNRIIEAIISEWLSNLN